MRAPKLFFLCLSTAYALSYTLPSASAATPHEAEAPSRGGHAEEACDSISPMAYLDEAEAPQPGLWLHADTVWRNPVTGSKVHLQRLSGTDTLVAADHSILKPVGEALAFNFGVWAWDHYLYDRQWADINARTIRTNLKSAFVLDNDSYSGNQFSHPYHGSMFYGAARYHGHSYYTAAVYPLIGSMVWEYFCENNLPAFNDFLSTGIGGSAIGEVTYRTSDIIFDNSKTGVGRVIRELVGGFLNPARGAHRLFSGEMWAVSPARGKHVQPEPFSLEVSVGNRYMHEMRGLHRSKNVGYVSFLMDYGDRFAKKDKPKPFDYFRMHMLLNLAGKNPTFSDLDIRGRIHGWQCSTKGDWRFDAGIYQVFRYLDNYGGKNDERPGNFALINEAMSFGVGLYTEKVGTHTSFSNDFLADGIGLGGTTADYYRPRRYSFASGYSLRNDARLTVNRLLSVGDDFYFARLYVHNGSGDPERAGNYYWGDEGHNSIFLNRAYLRLRMQQSLTLKIEHVLYYRRSTLAHYKDVHAKSYEMNLGLVYSL